MLSEILVRQFDLSKTWTIKKQELIHKNIIEKYIDDYSKIGYRFIPGSKFQSVRDKQFTINNLGFRDKPFNHQKNKKRVAFIGDSVIEGFGVDVEERATNIAEKELSKAFEIEFYNFGIEGYSTLDEINILKKFALPMQPDLVVLQICFNDLAHNFKLLNNISLKEKEEKKGIKHFFQKNSALYLFVAEKFNHYQLQGGQGNSFLNEIQQTPSLYWEIMFKQLDDFIKLCEVAHTKVAILYIPYDAEVLSTNDHMSSFVNNKLKGYSIKNEIVFVDVLSSLKQEQEDLYFDHAHFNKKGNEVLAKILIDHPVFKNF